ncbi:MAG: hypothetical protein K2N12_02185 [Helicobacter sp.]|nr:hypothetical protein [Helicobacter sp.]
MFACLVSLIGWVVTHYGTIDSGLLTICFVAVVVLTLMLFLLFVLFINKIKELEDL